MPKFFFLVSFKQCDFCILIMFVTKLFTTCRYFKYIFRLLPDEPPYPPPPDDQPLFPPPDDQPLLNDAEATAAHANKQINT